MQKYFISKEEMLNKRITSDDVNHIKNVMRGKIGDTFIVSDMENEFKVAIASLDKKSVDFEILEEITNSNEFPFLVDIYQGYPKGDKIEDIIKHSTELGAKSINPTFMKRSIVKLDEQRRKNKQERFSKIAKEAAEQSFRKIIPNVEILDLKKIDFSNYDIKIVCYEESAKENELSNFKKLVKNINNDSKIAVLIGPEGGLDSSEIEYLLDLGFTPCGLGPRILRTETAAMYVLSAISYETELK